MMGRTATVGAALWMALAALSLVGTGCGDDAAPSQTNPDVNPDPNPGPNPGPDGPMAVLEYVGDSTVGMAANSRADLRVRYIGADGSPQGDQPIQWTILGNAEESALDAQQSNTASDGVAQVQVRSAAREASFELEASVANNSNVAPIRFRVNVESKDFASYRVEVRYDGVRRFTNNNIKVSLFETPDNCDEFNPLQPGTAFRSEKRTPDANGFPMNFTFANLQNGTKYTVVATGFAVESNQAEVIGAFGCNADRPDILDGNNPEVIVIDMIDTLPIVDGNWSVTSRFNLSEALPENVQNILNPILDFFVDPGGTLTALLFEFLQDQFGFESSAITNVIEDIVTDLLENVVLGRNETIRDILTGGGDVSEVIRNFHLIGQMTIPADAVAANGVITQASMDYSQFGYRWRLNCESEEEFAMNPECGDEIIDFDLAGLTPVTANWDGAVTPNTDFDPASKAYFHHLLVNDHTISLNYGQIILYLIEQVALPLLIDEDIRSIESLLKRFIVCTDLFDSRTFSDICEVALDSVSDVLREQLTGLTFSSNNFTLGTFPDQPCGLYEQDDNDYGAPQPPAIAHLPRFNRMGKDAETDSNDDLRCVWNGQIQFSEDDTELTTFTGKWFGVKRFGN